MNIPVAAEGVETAAAWEVLAELGCDEFQGFLIAQPVGQAVAYAEPSCSAR